MTAQAGAFSLTRTALHRMHYDRQALALAGERPPIGECGRASFLECLSIDEMAFEIEVIVDVGVETGELLTALHAWEPLHGPLASEYN